MKRVVQVLIIFCLIGQTAISQDLIQRISQGITKPNSKPNKIAQEIMLKSDFTDIKPFSPIKNNKVKVFGEVKFKLNKSVLLKFENKNLRLTIPFNKEASLKLKLIPSDPLSPNYASFDEKGNVLKTEDYKFYKGIVEDDLNSIVTVVVSKTNVQVLILDDFGNYNLGQINKSETYVLYNDRNLPPLDFQCANIDNVINRSPKINEPDPDGGKQEKANGDCVKVHVIADFRTYQNFSNNASLVEAYIMNFWNAIETIYDNESIPIELSGTTIYTADDPFNAEISVVGALNNMNNNQGNVDNFINSGADLVHLISAKCSPNASCSYSGIANVYCGGGTCNVTALCQNDPWAVSETTTGYENYPTYSWTVNVFAHEMGHNMGSPHTHDCSWPGGPIDNCYNVEGGSCSLGADPGVSGGTIMSYCHICNFSSSLCNQYCSSSVPNCPNPGVNLNNGFGTIVGNHIRGQYMTASNSCLSGCSSTCSDGLQNGDETGVDCGGPDCDPCPTCSDMTMNGNETGVDCGGPDCPACQGCTDSNAHNYDPIATVDDGSCETCSDMVQNGDETNIDCGGAKCDPCVVGCISDVNAYNYNASSNVIVTCETCSDLIQNGDEEGVDCGGSYPGCVACPCLEVFASNYNMPGPCVYDCDASSTSLITDSNANSTIKSGANTMSTDDMNAVDVDMNGPFYWRARQSIELNGGFTIQAGSSLTIDVGDCEN